jgi:RNA polymerase sigma factor (TIGR02999 family)
MASSPEETSFRFTEDITAWLRLASEGDQEAGNRAYDLVRSKLREIARNQLRTDGAVSLTVTMVADDAYLKLIRMTKLSWQDRIHFLGMACEVVREVLTDHARRRKRLKRNSGQRPASFSDLPDPLAPETPEHILSLDDALTQLKQNHPDLAEVATLHVFGGWTLAEIAAEILNLPTSTVKHRWTRAKTLLHHYLTSNTSD